jgi:hypothetical protein
MADCNRRLKNLLKLTRVLGVSDSNANTIIEIRETLSKFGPAK